MGKITDTASGECWGADKLHQEMLKRSSYYYNSGIVAGDKVIIMHGNSAVFFVDLFALWNMGVCVVCLDSSTGFMELSSISDDLKAKAIIYRGSLSHEFVDAVCETMWINSDNVDAVADIAAIGELSLDDDALILYTSGSTGLPKGVVHSLRTLLAKWTILKSCVPLDMCERTLCFLSTSFGHGLICNSLYPLIHGCDLYILPKTDMVTLADLGNIIQKYNITFLSSVPSAWKMILKLSIAPPVGIIKQVNIGSAPLGEELWKSVQKWVGTNRVWNVYGITETGSWVCGPPPDQEEYLPIDGLVGVGWGSEILITDCDVEQADLLEEPYGNSLANFERGFVWLRTPTLMKRYINRDDDTHAVLRGEWYFTGDTGYLDDKSRLILTGRVRNEINKGGVKISPEELDLIIEKHPDIQDVCSFAVDDDILGENIGVCLVPVKKNSLPNVAKIIEWLDERLTSYKIPSIWYEVSEIPKTSRGKVNRNEVAKHCKLLSEIS